MAIRFMTKCSMIIPAVTILSCFTLSAFTQPVSADTAAQEQEKQDKKKKKTGTVVGEVTAKGKNYIEVKAFGEKEPRKYFPRWIGGLPSQGGGLEKKMLKTFKKLKVGNKIRMRWEFEERPRAVQIQILGKSTPPIKEKTKD